MTPSVTGFIDCSGGGSGGSGVVVQHTNRMKDHSMVHTHNSAVIRTELCKGGVALRVLLGGDC